jgi:hypothetical protein
MTNTLHKDLLNFLSFFSFPVDDFRLSFALKHPLTQTSS